MLNEILSAAGFNNHKVKIIVIESPFFIRDLILSTVVQSFDHPDSLLDRTLLSLFMDKNNVQGKLEQLYQKSLELYNTCDNVLPFGDFVSQTDYFVRSVYSTLTKHCCYQNDRLIFDNVFLDIPNAVTFSTSSYLTKEELVILNREIKNGP